MATTDLTLARARFVAEHWRAEMMKYQPAHGYAHPLNMVLNALDGETDPNELGLLSEAHEAFLAIGADDASD